MDATYLPGTLIACDWQRDDLPQSIFDPLFMADGLVLSQVAHLSGLERYHIQNWVKRGFVSPPVGKRYTRRQFARIIIINFLKDVMQIERVLHMLRYINGDLADERDDLIDDSLLYTYFVRLLNRGGTKLLRQPDALHALIGQISSDFAPPNPEAKQRLCHVLHIMSVAYASAHLRREAEALLQDLPHPTTASSHKGGQ